jgi:hypothetical protein
MSKNMFVCSRCGFTAFVERAIELERAGWRGEIRKDGAALVICADCIAESSQRQRPELASVGARPKAASR